MFQGVYCYIKSVGISGKSSEGVKFERSKFQGAFAMQALPQLEICTSGHRYYHGTCVQCVLRILLSLHDIIDLPTVT